MQSVEVVMQAASYERAPTEVVASVSVYGPEERWRRAARTALPLVGGAIVTLPLPAIHLFSVPGFLVAAAVLGLRKLREERVFESASGPCPGCAAALDLRPPAGTLPPYVLPCPECGEFLKLSELR